MTWQLVALVVAAAFLILSFTAVQRWFNILERKHGGTSAETRLGQMERELGELKKAFFTSNAPKKAGY